MASLQREDIPVIPKLDLNNRNHGYKVENNKKRFKHDRSSRKRSKSFSGCGLINPKPVLPTKFLLGGNINDPLNLNSLQDEDINRAMNAVTPKSSPLPTPPRKKMPVEVIVSPNSFDPLHLLDCKNDKEYEKQLCSPVKKGRKKRIKKRRTMSASAEGSVPEQSGIVVAKTPEATTDSAKIPEDPQDFTDSNINLSLILNENETAKDCTSLACDLTKDKKEKLRRRSEDTNSNHVPVKRFKHFKDKIVSPVVPQPGSWLKRSNSIKLPRPKQMKSRNETLPTFKEDNKKFQYGNYNRYYGYRNPNNEMDQRLKILSQHPYIFENKDILDIGCNIGHITLCIARDFEARTITGIDIDPNLISIARKNIKHYVKTAGNSPHSLGGSPASIAAMPKSSSEFFPISLPILYGPIDIPGFHDNHQGRGFPKNVSFKQCNYVLEDESLLAFEQPQFDVILCLSITKWIHLNWGDNGLKLAFRRMYEQLRPGGKLILEPQHWSGYKSKKKLTETIYRNYSAIEFFPDKFRDYLLSPAVGFAKSEILGFPQHKSIGFKRPILMFTKSTMFPSERVEATPKNPVDNNYPKLLQIEIGKVGSPNTGIVKEHVYTNMLQVATQYSNCSTSNQDDGELSKIESDNRAELEDTILNSISGCSYDISVAGREST